MPSYPEIRATRAEIDLDNLGHNLREFRRYLSPQTRIMAVVKADAYGHGAVEVSRAALEHGAQSLGVAALEEGIELRCAGIKAPILLLGYTPASQGKKLIQYGLEATVFTWETAAAFSGEGVAAGRPVPVHIKIDTGMGRIGVQHQDALSFIRRVSELPGLEIKGIFTHFATADEEDKSYAYEQFRRFKEIIAACRASRIKIPLLHAANTAAAIDLPETHLDLVRLGIGLYGCYPSPLIKKEKVKLAPVLSFKTRIVYLKKVPAGSAISYGCTYHTSRESLIATVPVGYGDGYPRILSNRAEALLHGCRVPVVGRVCMDQLMLRVDEVPDVAVGDEVVLYGQQGESVVGVDEIAHLAGTINYEVLCAVSKRVPRLYYSGGKLAAVRDFLN
ncbi:MAG: alanine racemase [Dethiobacteria bacterium]|nr:alanine racemase [Bacillota bacterium]